MYRLMFNRLNAFNKLKNSLALISHVNVSTQLDRINELEIPTSNPVIYQQIRFKKTYDHNRNKNKSEEEQEEDNEDDDEYEDAEDDDDSDLKNIDTSGFLPGFKIVKKHVSSMRFDSILAGGLNMSRNKVDDFFYSSKLRLNGNKVLKKSSPVKENDRLDLIGEMDEKSGKRTMKRVLLYKVYETKSKNKNKPKCILISWKSGLFEEDSYKSSAKLN